MTTILKDFKSSSSASLDVAQVTAIVDTALASQPLADVQTDAEITAEIASAMANVTQTLWTSTDWFKPEHSSLTSTFYLNVLDSDDLQVVEYQYKKADGTPVTTSHLVVDMVFTTNGFYSGGGTDNVYTVSIDGYFHVIAKRSPTEIQVLVVESGVFVEIRRVKVNDIPVLTVSKEQYVDDVVAQAKKVSLITNSGRFYCYTDTRWVTDSDDNYGSSYYQFNENSGKGAEPVIEWEHLGILIPKGTKIKSLMLAGKTNAVGVSDVEIRVIAKSPNPLSRWETGIDIDSEVSTVELASVNFVTPAMSGNMLDLRLRTIDLGDFVAPNDLMLSLYVRPTSAGSGTRYFSVTYTYEIEGAEVPKRLSPVLPPVGVTYKLPSIFNAGDTPIDTGYTPVVGVAYTFDLKLHIGATVSLTNQQSGSQNSVSSDGRSYIGISNGNVILGFGGLANISVPLTANTTYECKIIYSGSNITMVVNGQTVESDIPTVATNPSLPMYIGARNYAGILDRHVITYDVIDAVIRSGEHTDYIFTN